MRFPHILRKLFFADYAIKQGQVPTERSFNLHSDRVKRELDDLYNMWRIQGRQPALDWYPQESYEVGEIANYNGINYECQLPCIAETPSNKSKYWKPIVDSDLTEFYAGRYIAKDDSTPYDPGQIFGKEPGIDFHPVNVKYLETRLRYWFDNEKVKNADTLDGFDSSYFTPLQTFNSFVSRAITSDKVIDNLDSNSRIYPLSANQGRVLNNLIKSIQKILKSDDLNLDELQEIVDFIKKNKKTLDSLGIDSIKGLRTELEKLRADTDNKISLEFWNSEFLKKLLEVAKKDAGVVATYIGDTHYSKVITDKQFTPENIVNIINKNNKDLNADMLDGLDSTDFLRRTANDTPSKDDTFSLGSPTAKWANIYSTNFIGTASMAKYADLAEFYAADAEYSPGTVLGIGENGISIFNSESESLIGVVSKNPGFVLNEGNGNVCVALKGQVLVKLDPSIKNIKLGQKLYASHQTPGTADIYELGSHEFLGVVIEAPKNGYVKIKI